MTVLSTVLFIVVAFTVLANAQLLSNIFGDHMVLQRAPEKSNVFGWTKNAGERVIVYVDSSNKVEVISNAAKSFIVNLPAFPAGGPHTISVISETASQNLTDVYFGDVFVCSGQSNMQFTVHSVFNASEEIADSANYPQIRVFTVGQSTISFTPLEQLQSIEQNWAVAGPDSVGHGDWSYFSAVCWLTAKNLYDQYKVPLGLISSNWGGTIIQAWSSPAALKKCNVTSTIDTSVLSVKADQQKRIKVIGGAPKKPDVNPNQNSVLYNAMIYPLRLLKIRSVLWYQGENNVGQAAYYTCAFPTMIADWKSLFNLQDIKFSFFFVQLAAYPNGGNLALAEERQAQEAGLTLDYVGMGTAIDLGDLGSPFGSIHPRNKQTVGKRLSLAARAISYGEKDLVYQGPTAVSAIATSDFPNAVASVSFSPSSVGGGLALAAASCPSTLGAQYCAGGELQSSDGKWYAATSITLAGDNVNFGVTVSGLGLKVTGVRYAFSDWPLCTVYNVAGLPAPPFNLAI